MTHPTTTTGTLTPRIAATGSDPCVMMTHVACMFLGFSLGFAVRWLFWG